MSLLNNTMLWQPARSWIWALLFIVLMTGQSHFIWAADCIQLPVSCRVSSPWGMRLHPVKKVQKMHRGMDFACPSGTAVKAAHPGKAFGSYNYGGGNTVTVEIGGRRTLYMHNSYYTVPEKSGFKEVAVGDSIAASGNTGAWTTGPHVHFELWENGKNVNPADYFCNKINIPSGNSSSGGSGGEDSHGDGYTISTNSVDPVPGYQFMPLEPQVDLKDASLMETLESAVNSKILNPEWVKSVMRMPDTRLYAEIAFLRSLLLKIEERKSKLNEYTLMMLSDLQTLKARERAIELETMRRRIIDRN